MDSSAYLTRHGWRGEGHALHPTGRGIKKPLLVSRKANVLGVGKKKNDIHADQWWARAFDSGLKSLDVNKAVVLPGNIGAKLGALGALELVKCGGGKWSGLYSGFIKGKGLDGTLGDDGPSISTTKVEGSKKRLEVRSKSYKRQAEALTPWQDTQQEDTATHINRQKRAPRPENDDDLGIKVVRLPSVSLAEKAPSKLERKEMRRLRRLRRLDRRLERAKKESTASRHIAGGLRERSDESTDGLGSKAISNHEPQQTADKVQKFEARKARKIQRAAKRSKT